MPTPSSQDTLHIEPGFPTASCKTLDSNTLAPLTGDPASSPISNFEDGITDSCLCGSITFSITQQDVFTKANGHVCHCANCRKFRSSAAAYVLMLPIENVELSDPKQYLKTYFDSDTGSGGTVPRGFCSECGSGIGAFPPKDSGKKYVFLSADILPRLPKPEFELFMAHRHDWEKPIDGAKQYQFCEEVVNYM